MSGVVGAKSLRRGVNPLRETGFVVPSKTLPCGHGGHDSSGTSGRDQSLKR